MRKTCFQAGFGKGVIRFPDALFPIEGFCGIHDDPCARLMVIQAGETGFALASLELVMLPDPLIGRCKEIIESHTGIPAQQIWVHVTHAISTPHEPGPKGPPNKRPPATEEDKKQQKLYSAAIEAAMGQAAVEAARNLAPARLGWGQGDCHVTCNRDVETPYGWWMGLNPDGLSNHTMMVLRVESMSGGPLGFFVSYSVKPCAVDNAGMENGTRLVSSDVGGVCVETLERQYGVPALFCISAAGDQVPREQAILDVVDGDGKYHHRDFGVDKGMEIIARLGAEMGQDALNIAAGIVCDTAEIGLNFGEIQFDWDSKPGRPSGPSKTAPDAPSEGMRQVSAELVMLGDTALVGTRPEINCKTELELKEASPVARTLLMMMVNGGMKYMPDWEAYAKNTFESQSSFLRQGAAEEFVRRTAEALAEMTKPR